MPPETKHSCIILPDFRTHQLSPQESGVLILTIPLFMLIAIHWSSAMANIAPGSSFPFAPGGQI